MENKNCVKNSVKFQDQMKITVELKSLETKFIILGKFEIPVK